MDYYRPATILSYDKVQTNGQLSTLKLFLHADAYFKTALRENNRLRKAFIELTKPGGSSAMIDQTDQQFVESSLGMRATFACAQKVFLCKHIPNMENPSYKLALLNVANNELKYIKQLVGCFSSSSMKFHQAKIDNVLEMGGEEDVNEHEDLDAEHDMDADAELGRISDDEE